MLLTAIILNTIGLILDIIGAWILFKYGAPKSTKTFVTRSAGNVYGGGGLPNKVSLENENEGKAKKGFLVLIFGFSFQIIGNLFVFCNMLIKS